MLQDYQQRLCDVEQPPPNIHTAADVLGLAFEPFVLAVLSSLEDILKRLFTPAAFLQWHLGGPGSIILIILRTLSTLSPLQSRLPFKDRFNWVAVRLHYFVTHLLLIRRSIISAKSALASFEHHADLATFVSAWEQGLSPRLQAWTMLILKDDLRGLTIVASPNLAPFGQSEHNVYRRTTQLRWYDITKPGTAWQVSFPLPSLQSLSATIASLGAVDTTELGLLSLCHFGTYAFGLMVAKGPSLNYEALVTAIQRSSGWEFEPPFSSSSSDITDVMEQGASPAADSLGITPQRRSGTPVSPSASPNIGDIGLPQPATMRSVIQAQADNEQSIEEAELGPPLESMDIEKDLDVADNANQEVAPAPRQSRNRQAPEQPRRALRSRTCS